MKIKKFIGGFVAFIIVASMSFFMNILTSLTNNEDIGSIGGAFLAALLAWLAYRIIVGKSANESKTFKLDK